MEEKKKKNIKPVIFIIIGIVYIVNPFDIPGPFDDIIVGFLSAYKAMAISMAQRKAEEFIFNKTGMDVDLSVASQAASKAMDKSIKAKHNASTVTDADNTTADSQASNDSYGLSTLNKF